MTFSVGVNNILNNTNIVTGGFEQLRKGEYDALLRVVQKPLGVLNSPAVPPNSGLHMIPVPYSKKFTDLYALAEFTSAVGSRSRRGLFSLGLRIASLR